MGKRQEPKFLLSEILGALEHAKETVIVEKMIKYMFDGTKQLFNQGRRRE